MRCGFYPWVRNPLQYSCLANPMDRGGWWATVHGVTRVRYNLWLNNKNDWSIHWREFPNLLILSLMILLKYRVIKKKKRLWCPLLSWCFPGSGWPFLLDNQDPSSLCPPSPHPWAQSWGQAVLSGWLFPVGNGSRCGQLEATRADLGFCRATQRAPKGLLWCHPLRGMVNCIFSGKIPRTDPRIKSLLWISDHLVLTLHLDHPVPWAAGGFVGCGHWRMYGFFSPILFHRSLEKKTKLTSILYWGITLEEGMATHSSILAWKILWTEESDRLQSTASQRAGHYWSNWTQSRLTMLW